MRSRPRPHSALLSAAAALSVAALVMGGVDAATAPAHRAQEDAPVDLASASGGAGSDVPVVAHRGAPRNAPEETLASYREALAQGADVLEGDVQLTSDGRMVLVHDDTLARTTDVAEVFPDRADAKVGAFTLAEIKRLDAGTWHREGFAGERVPTVEELLKLNRGRAAVTLELKSPVNSPGVATELAKLLDRYGLDDAGRTRFGAWKIMVHSRDKDALHAFGSVLPDVPLVHLTGGAMLGDAELKDLSTWTVGVFADPRLTTASDVKRAHDAGLVVYSDPVDSPEQIDMALDQGYDYLVTNLTGTATRVRDGKNPEPRAAGVVVDHVIENPSGDDVQAETGEHITLRNTTGRPIDVGGHYLRDGAGNVRVFIGDGYVIQPGSLLKVYIGKGTNSPTAYYNGYTTGILNNTAGDTIQYYNERHQIEDVYSYIAPLT
ncbi:glycerophosphodiester phosphodiesterase family protein [Streptomyces sp. NPDC091289]|uniref:glycerophosphodiester phosphodiesterase family protein n=1 Tax=Streptomyces sp. NPDC091289 TaxID=3365989 RepID=UPI003828E50C